MSKARRFPFIAKVCIALFIGFLLVFGQGIFFLLLGYHVGSGVMYGEKIAEFIAKEKRNPQECRWIKQLGIGEGPSESEVQSYCIYHVAQLNKDPIACILLMPSDYGRACIGEIWGSLDYAEPCQPVTKTTFECISENDPSKYEKLSIANCDQLGRQVARDWCYAFESGTAKSADNCIKVQSEKPKDECWLRLAYAEKKISICDEILEPVRKSVCQVRIQNP